MDRESARSQFDDLTEKYGVEHTFSFDKAWDFLEYKEHQDTLTKPDKFFPPKYTKDQFRKGITDLEKKMIEDENSVTPETDPDFNPIKHTFTDKQYIREIFNPAGEMLVTKIHTVEHPFFLLRGEMSILTEEGETYISAPYYGVTPVGTKRIIYAHTDCTFVTVHPTSCKDISKIEEEVTAKNYQELSQI